MSSKRYTEEFKVEAVRQVVERGHSVAEVMVEQDYPQAFTLLVEDSPKQGVGPFGLCTRSIYPP